MSSNLQSDLNQFSGHYVEWRERRIKAIIEHYGQEFFQNKTVLELGCGYGEIGAHFASLGAQVTCSDAREEHLNIVRQKYPYIKTVLADLDKEWVFNRHDIIILMGVLYHLRDHKPVLEKACNYATYLILETEVCDYDDGLAVVKTFEDADAYDQSFNKYGCRPSTKNIEHILNRSNMVYETIIDDRCNSSFHRYDWIPENTGKYEHGQRRFWFAHQTALNLKPDNSTQQINDYLEYVNRRYFVLNKTNQNLATSIKKTALLENNINNNNVQIQMSIIIPTSGRVNLFLETLESLSKQTLKLFEVIVSDDSPSEEDRDSICEALQLFNKKTGISVEYIFSKPKLYQAKNTNQGLLKARGNYVRILHSDDILSPEAIEQEVKFFQQFEGKVNIIYHDIIPFNSHEKINWISFNKDVELSLISPAYLLANWLHSGTAIPSGLAFTKQALERTSLLDSKYRFICDWKFFYNIVKNEFLTNNMIGHFSEKFVGWRTHQNSVTGKLWYVHFLEHEIFINEIKENKDLQKVFMLSEYEAKKFFSLSLSYRYKRLINDYIQLRFTQKFLGIPKLFICLLKTETLWFAWLLFFQKLLVPKIRDNFFNKN